MSLKQAQDLGQFHHTQAQAEGTTFPSSPCSLRLGGLDVSGPWERAVSGCFWALGKSSLPLAHSSNSRQSPGPGEGDLVGESP